MPAHWTRKQLRSMGRVSRLAVGAAEQALQDAGLLGNPIIQDGRMGVSTLTRRSALLPVL